MVEEVADKIIQALGRKPLNLDTLIIVYETYHMGKDLKTDELHARTELRHATFFRAYKTLKDHGLLEDPPIERDYELPAAIRMGRLPPVRYSTVHLVNYLTKFKTEETVPPYGKTKGQIIEDMRRKMATDAEIGADVIYGIQERLALLSLFNGNLTAFESMVGNCEPPTEI